MCGGMIHTVDKVLLPPGGNTVEVIKNNGKLSKFLELIEFAELENELIADGPVTVLAPTDVAFKHLSEELSNKAFSDRDVAARIVHNHVMSDMVCCSGISRHVPMLIDMSGRRTQSGDVISLRRSRGGHIYADRAEVTTCDMVATNGVVHAIDRILIPDSLRDEVSGDHMDKVDQISRRRSYSPFESFFQG